jgi:3-dehydroquinate synthase
MDHLLERGMDFDRETVIARCVELKRDVVMEDEFDTGARQKLNLGHTIGHGIEAGSGFSISHGKAVAAGMAIVARASCTYGICDNATTALILKVLGQFHLPTGTDFTADELYRAALSDKKRSGGTVNLIIPKTIGNCMIHPMPVEAMLPFIKAGL